MMIMRTYSLLFIGANKLIGESKRIECSSDDQAIDMATRELGDYRAIQVWDGDRSVCIVGNPRNIGDVQ